MSSLEHRRKHLRGRFSEVALEDLTETLCDSGSFLIPISAPFEEEDAEKVIARVVEQNQVVVSNGVT